MTSVLETVTRPIKRGHKRIWKKEEEGNPSVGIEFLNWKD